MPDSAFYDNSSASLGLEITVSYRSGGIAAFKAKQDAEYEAALRSLGIACDEHGLPQIQHIIPDNAGAHDALALLLNAGYHWSEALDLLDALSAIGQAQESTEDEDGPKESDSAAFFEWCMKSAITPDKRGSRSRSKKKSSGRSVDPLQTAVIRCYGRVA